MDRYLQTEGRILLSGTQALIRIPLDQRRADQRAGLNSAAFISGYPGSPLGGLDHELHRQRRLLEEHAVKFQPGVNEDLAATAVFGTQLLQHFPGARHDGVLGIWYGKAPGLDRSVDILRHFNLGGVDPRGGTLLYVGDDPASKSSTVPSGSEATLLSLGIPILFPGSVQEILDLGLLGAALSRASGLLVALKIVTAVADGSGTAEVGPDRIRPVIPTVELDGQPFVNRPNPSLLANFTLPQERNMHLARLELARRFAAVNGLNRITVRSPGAWLGVAAAGKVYADLRQSLAEMGLDEAELTRLGVRLLKISMLYPLERGVVREFAQGLSEILVVEEKREFLELFIKEALYGGQDQPRVVGKYDEEQRPLLPYHGELDPEVIGRAVAGRLIRLEHPGVGAYLERLDRLTSQSLTLPMVARTPYFCSGCPHNRSTVLPEGALGSGGIGCHGLVLTMKREHIGITHMGGEGAQWIGLSPFLEPTHLFQNIGDGTLFHSGMLAIGAAVASGVNITYKILYNSAIAMTGGQSSAAALAVPALAQKLEAEGVKRILITTEEPERYDGVRIPAIAEVWDRDRLLEAQAELARIPGTTVLLHDQQCAAEKRRLRKRGRLEDPTLRLFINERVCEGCGDCGEKSNCLSVHPVETEFGRKTRIHQGSCNKDYSCLLGDCPSFLAVEPAVAVEPSAAEPGEVRGRRPLPFLPDELPEPHSVPLADGEPFHLYMVGIGGTGVVTANQILSTAAYLAGSHCEAYDQTGLSQKGGPVVSSLRVSRAPLEGGNRVMTGKADMVLGMDILTLADPRHLSRANPDRTVAVVSTSRVATGQMVSNPNVSFPRLDWLRSEIDGQTRAASNQYIDSLGLTESLFGDPMTANLLMVGAGYQTGRLPIPGWAIEEAIRLNGVAVEQNLLAFRAGRLAVADPAALAVLLNPAAAVSLAAAANPATPGAPALTLPGGWDPGGELGRLLTVRFADLADYQNPAHASAYLGFVRQAAEAEQAVMPGLTRLSEAVARSLHKLMAYKDEYEVARLQLDATAAATLEREFGKGARVWYHLHPPFLRALGMTKKLKLGAWFRPFLALLRSMKVLRGTPLDPFGYAGLRREERRLVAEYRTMIAEVLRLLTPAGYDLAVQAAQAPDQIRGYEGIKLTAIGRYREETGRLLAQLRARAEKTGA